MVGQALGNGLWAFGLVNDSDQRQVMAQQTGTWRTGRDQRAWLSMLIDAMEQTSRPEPRAVPCDIDVLAALRAQLARPATVIMPYASSYSLRN
jgi:hypothetical protein